MVQGRADQDPTGVKPSTRDAASSPGLKTVAQVLGLMASGAAAALAVCWPFPFLFVPGEPVWWLQILLLAPLFAVVTESPTRAHAFGCGALYASSWLCATFWWLYVAMHTYGGLPSVLAVAAVLALAAALSLYYALACALVWSLANSGPALAAVAFAAAWTMAEMARGTWFTGFGWGAMGYAHTQGPLQFWIPLLGAYGVTALAALVAASLAQLLKAGWLQRLLLVAVLGAGAMFPAIQSTATNGNLSVALLQGNIAQDEKFEAGTGVPLALQWYGEHLSQSKSELVLAPETAIPLLPQELPQGYWDRMVAKIAQGGHALLTGIPMGDYAQGYTNSVMGLQPGTDKVWRYDKYHLVPFGEFIPPFFKWFTRLMHIPLGDFNRGAIGQPSFAWKGQRIAANICYEDLFGEELAARFTEPAEAPTVFANVSNLAWFGNTFAIDQHLQISRMRALEFQRPFLRATNTGATVVLDYQGQVVAALPRFTTGVLHAVVEGRTGITPYAWWASQWRLWPLWLVALATLGFIWRQARATGLLRGKR